MKETLIIEKSKMKKLKNAVLVTGLPGIGLIGQVVGRYLVEELKAKNAWAFTIGSAIFERRFVKEGSIQDQIRAVLDTL